MPTDSLTTNLEFNPAALDTVSALLGMREVALVMGRDESMVQHWVEQGDLHRTKIAGSGHFKYDRHDVERLVGAVLTPQEDDAARRRLLRLCLGELAARDLAEDLVETGFVSPTAAYLDSELLHLVREAGSPDAAGYTGWAMERGAPTAEQVMQRLAIYSWPRLYRRAALTGQTVR